MPWILIGLLGCVIIFLAVKAFKAVTATAEEETERMTTFILCVILMAACAFAIRYIATYSLTR